MAEVENVGYKRTKRGEKPMPNELYRIDQDGKIEYSKEIEALVVARAKSFALEQNFPNPLNPSTTISYGLPMDCHVRIAIYNSIGQLAAQLINASQAAGWHQVMWNAEVSSGVYLCRIEAISQSNSNIHFVDTKKMVLTR